jgi:signal transduction histidine kinase
MTNLDPKTRAIFKVPSIEDGVIARLVAAFREISAATVGALELDRELNSILEEITDRLRFEFAAIALVDEYRGVIETVRGKNVPLGWREVFKCRLDSEYILANVVRSGKTQVVREWDPRLDREIYERFGFARAVRVFTPILAETKVVGIIWAGCPIDHADDIVTPQTIEAVTQLGISHGQAVANSRPHVLLEVIARHAIGIIEADSASIHIYQNHEKLLEATAGNATSAFLHKYPPTQTGIGIQAMRSGEPAWIDDADKLKETHPGLYQEGVRAFAAFPLAFGTDVRGVVYVHFWKQHQITLFERELEAAFTLQMEVAIKNSLLMKDVAEYAEKAWMVSGLQKIIQSLASQSNLPKVVDEVARSVLYMLGADCVTLYPYFEKEKRFQFPPVMAGTFSSPQLMHTQIEPGDAVWKLVETGASLFVADTQTDGFLSGPRTDNLDQPRFVDREKIRSLAVLTLKAGELNETVGLMFVNYRRPREFPKEDKRVIITLGSSAAIAIQSVRLHDQIQRELRRRNREVDALREVDRIISSDPVPNLHKVLDLILHRAADIIGATAGSVWTLNQTREELQLDVSWPNTNKHRVCCRLGEGIVGQAAKERRAILLPSLWEHAHHRTHISSNPGPASELAVPLQDAQGLIGIIYIQLNAGGIFTEEDQALLETFAVLAVTAVHIVDEYRQLNEQIRSLRSLGIIQARIQDASHDLDTLLQMFATGITVKQGLGFSRAMVFLTDDDETKLIGAAAVGALTLDEAQDTWRNLDVHADALKDKGEGEIDILLGLLKQAEQHAMQVKEGKAHYHPLCQAVKQVSTLLATQKGAIGKCLADGKARIMQDSETDPFRDILVEMSGTGEEERAFACAPLIGKQRKRLGVVVVDNRFLPAEREIDKAKLHSLEAFAGLAAMSIENLRLRDAYRDQADNSEKKAQMFRDVLAETAHEFRSPLQNILGQIPVLKEHIPATSTVDKILSGVEDEISRAKKVMANSLTFGAEFAYNFVPLCPMRPILEKCALEYENRASERNVHIVIWDSAKRLKLDMDPERIQQIITNLLDNAVKYSFNGESIHIRGQETGSVVHITVQDKGIGIPEAYQSRIFDEFVRQVVTDRKRFIPGTGIGLKVVHDIIKAHGGSIQVSSIPFLNDPLRRSPADGHTVTFTVKLPKTRLHL